MDDNVIDFALLLMVLVEDFVVCVCLELLCCVSRFLYVQHNSMILYVQYLFKYSKIFRYAPANTRAGSRAFAAF